jgi:hypothetical protein
MVTMSSDQAVTATFAAVTPRPSCTVGAKSAKVLLPTVNEKLKRKRKPGTVSRITGIPQV